VGIAKSERVFAKEGVRARSAREERGKSTCGTMVGRGWEARKLRVNESREADEDAKW
jgi:hypothetical protein